MPKSTPPRQKRVAPKQVDSAPKQEAPPIQITFQDLRMVVNVIDMASKAGAFVGPDITVAGQLRAKFSAIAPPPVANPEGAPSDGAADSEAPADKSAE